MRTKLTPSHRNMFSNRIGSLEHSWVSAHMHDWTSAGIALKNTQLLSQALGLTSTSSEANFRSCLQGGSGADGCYAGPKWLRLLLSADGINSSFIDTSDLGGHTYMCNPGEARRKPPLTFVCEFVRTNFGLVPPPKSRQRFARAHVVDHVDALVVPILQEIVCLFVCVVALYASQ